MKKKQRTYRELVLLQLLYMMMTLLFMLMALSNGVLWVPTMIFFNMMFGIMERLPSVYGSNLKVAKVKPFKYEVHTKTGINLTRFSGLIFVGSYSYPFKWMAVLHLWGMIFEAPRSEN